MTPALPTWRPTSAVRPLRFSVRPILVFGDRSGAALASSGKVNLKTSPSMRYYSLYMQRMPEPELMDEQEQSAAYAAADWSEAHEKVPAHFRERFLSFNGGRVIDLGCGTADVTIRFARAYPKATILGVDGSETMLSFGRRAVRAAGFDSRVTLERRFLPDPAIEKRSFDALFSNSLLHHMADPVVLWRT